MKSKLVAYLLVFSLLLPTVVAEEICTPRFDIFAEIKAKDRGTETDSIFQFSSFRETDILRLEKLTVRNLGKCATERMIIQISIKPQAGYTPPEKHGVDYNEFSIPFPPMRPNDEASLIRTESSQYILTNPNEETFPNYQYSHWGIDLDQTGNWDVTYEIKDKNYLSLGTSSNFRLNGRDLRWFRVYPTDDLETLINNRQTLDLTKQMYYLTALVAIITGIDILLAFHTWYNNKKENKNRQESNINIRETVKELQKMNHMISKKIDIIKKKPKIDRRRKNK